MPMTQDMQEKETLLRGSIGTEVKDGNAMRFGTLIFLNAGRSNSSKIVSWVLDNDNDNDCLGS